MEFEGQLFRYVGIKSILKGECDTHAEGGMVEGEAGR